MNPIFLFSILVLIAALVMLRLRDRVLLRVLGLFSAMVLGPAIALSTEAMNWRVHLGHTPTTTGYTLVTIAAIGAIFTGAGLVSAMLRTAIDTVRVLRKAKPASK